MKIHKGVEVYLQTFLILPLDCGDWSGCRLGCFASGAQSPYTLAIRLRVPHRQYGCFGDEKIPIP